MISKNNSFKDITEKIKFYISNFTVNIKKIIKKNKLIVISLFSFIIFMLVSMFFLINLNQDKIIDKLNEALLNENKINYYKKFVYSLLLVFGLVLIDNILINTLSLYSVPNYLNWFFSSSILGIIDAILIFVILFFTMKSFKALVLRYKNIIRKRNE